MTERQVVQLHPAYLLHARPYRDSSSIAEFFTQDFGRVALVARGARRPKSSFRGVLQPFLPVLVSWTSRGSLGTLTALEMAAGQGRGLPRNLLSGYYVNELILRAVRSGDSHQELFQRYSDVLKVLSMDANEANTLRVFERDLLNDLGYGLRLDVDGDGEAVHGVYEYRIDIHAGPIVTGRVDPNDDAYSSARVVSGSTLLELHAGALTTNGAHREAKHLLRDALAFHLGQHTSKVRDVVSSMHSHRRRWQESIAVEDDAASTMVRTTDNSADRT